MVVYIGGSEPEGEIVEEGREVRGLKRGRLREL